MCCIDFHNYAEVEIILAAWQASTRQKIQKSNNVDHDSLLHLAGQRDAEMRAQRQQAAAAELEEKQREKRFAEEEDKRRESLKEEELLLRRTQRVVRCSF